MKDIKAIFNHVIDEIESVYEMAQDDEEIKQKYKNPLEGGLKFIEQDFYASLGKYDSREMSLNNFISFCRKQPLFELYTDEQEKLLKVWRVNAEHTIEHDYYKAIYPVFKMLYDEVED
jgi:hypothetical protein